MTELTIDPDNSLYYEYIPSSSGKPTFVFVNALTGNTQAWEQVVAPYCREQGFGTLSYNMRGQVDTRLGDGVTPDCDLIVNDLSLLLKELAPEKPILCGLSIGGLFAARAALQGSECHALILLNMLRIIGPRLQWLNENMVNILDTGGFKLMMDSYLPLLTNEEFHAARRNDHLTGDAYEPEDKNSGAYRLMSAAGSADWNIDYEKLSMPVLTITGLQDRIFYDPAVFEQLAARLPDAKHVKWNNAGHLLPMEVPQQLADELVDFAQALEARTV